MMFGIGIALFALAILVSVALHECGHMWVAPRHRHEGASVLRRLRSHVVVDHRPNRLGSTEYGVKAIPFGGFCDIAGMTSVEDLAARGRAVRDVQAEDLEAGRRVVRRPGNELHHRPGAGLRIAVVWGLPDLHPPTTAVVGETTCVKPEITKGELGNCTGSGPAAAAGIKAGDVVVKVGPTEVKTFEEMVAAVQKASGPTPFVVERTVDGNDDDRGHGGRRQHDQALGRTVRRRRGDRPVRRRRNRHRRRAIRPDPVQPADGDPGDVHLHRRPRRGDREVAGGHPDQGRRSGARHRRRRT